MTAPSVQGSAIMKPSTIEAPAPKKEQPTPSSREQLDKEIESYMWGRMSALARQLGEYKAGGEAGRQDSSPRTETAGGNPNTDEVNITKKTGSGSSLGLNNFPAPGFY